MLYALYILDPKASEFVAPNASGSDSGAAGGGDTTAIWEAVHRAMTIAAKLERHAAGGSLVAEVGVFVVSTSGSLSYLPRRQLGLRTVSVLYCQLAVFCGATHTALFFCRTICPQPIGRWGLVSLVPPVALHRPQQEQREQQQGALHRAIMSRAAAACHGQRWCSAKSRALSERFLSLSGTTC